MTELSEALPLEVAPRDAAPSAETIVIDAGVGNLDNLARALNHVSGQPAGSKHRLNSEHRLQMKHCRVTTDPQVIASAKCLVLPGVGAFRPPRETLRGALEEALRSAVDNGAWLLGICVGFQLLFDCGEEFGTTDGLGLLPGVVRQLPDTVPVPHIGWNRLHDEASHPLFAGIPSASYFYFVHSFAPFVTSESTCLATATHGAPFAAVAGRDRVLGTQFHPERSGPAGLRLLSNYLELAHAADPSN